MKQLSKFFFTFVNMGLFYMVHAKFGFEMALLFALAYLIAELEVKNSR